MKENRLFISVIVLAAGESKRMGEPKQLMPFGSSTIIEKTIGNFLDSDVTEIILVTGYKSSEIVDKVAGKPVKIVENSNYLQGMSTSISAGLNQVSIESQGVMIALADQPFVDSQTINHLIKEFGVQNKGILIPCYRSERGHPVIFSFKYKEALMALKGDVGGKEIINNNPDDVAEIEVECYGIVADIDTKESYYLAEQDFE
jgi:molybdenum cofactor cytidylyltransferase